VRALNAFQPDGKERERLTPRTRREETMLMQKNPFAPFVIVSAVRR
jgi:hypothetical protein